MDSVNIHDLERQAEALLDPGVFGYFAGGSCDELTLNENVADLAGLLAAYDAYHKSLAAEHDKVDRKTADRRFFIAYAQSYRDKESEEALRDQIESGPVAPAMDRVATVRNLDAWYSW